MYPRKGYEQGHQLIACQFLKLVKAYLVNISLTNGFADLKELLSIGDKFGLELADRFLDLRLFLIETLLEEDFKFVEFSDVMLEFLFEFKLFFLY